MEERKTHFEFLVHWNAWIKYKWSIALCQQVYNVIHMIIGCSLQDPLYAMYIKCSSNTHASSNTHTHSVHRNIFIAYLSLFDYKLWFWTLFPFRQNKCFVCAVAFAFAFVLSCWSSSFIAVRLRGIVSFLFWGIFCSCTEHTEHSTHYIHAWKFFFCIATVYKLKSIESFSYFYCKRMLIRNDHSLWLYFALWLCTN